MHEFRFANYSTKYSLLINGETKVPMRSYACFRDAFILLSRENAPQRITAEYEIILHVGCDWGKINNKSNACLLSRKDLRQHLDQIKDIIPFTYKIKSDRGDEPKFILNVKVTKGTCIQHKYMLSWIRYAYEYPYNVMLLESRKLRWEKEFRFETGYNLFNLVAQCFDLWGGGHSIAYRNKVDFMKKPSLIRKISNMSRLNSLNNIFECSYNGRVAMIPTVSERKPPLSTKDIEFWTDNELYMKERLPIYKKRLKILKRT